MSFLHYFKLFRWKNLFLVTYIFILLKFIFFLAFEISHQLSNLQFSTLLLSVLFIMSAGYIINDIFDIETDAINKKNNLVSKHISIEKSKRLYLILNTIGITLGVFLCLKLNQPKLSFIFFGAPLLLYFYSKKWKTKPLIGNLIISFLVALCTVLLFIIDVDFLKYFEEKNFVKHIVLGLSFFAFITNLIREICKDIEDLKGDYALNMNTLPILIGRGRTKNIALILISILAISIAFIIINLASIHKLASLYLVLIVLPTIVFTFYKLKNAKTDKHFKKVNTYLKIIMFLGINSLLILSIQSNVL